MSRYLVQNRAGEEIAASLGVEDALLLMRVLPAGDRVIRESDGVVLASRLRGPLKDQRPNPRVPGMYPGIGGFGAN